MPKATLVFKLPEERDEFRDAQNGTAMAAAIHIIRSKIRNILKHRELTEEQRLIVEEIQLDVFEATSDFD